jgi:hypothetical protein
MFKKKTVNKSRAALRQRPIEDDSDEGDGANDGTEPTKEQLAAIRKKRKLLTAVQYKKGVAATDLQKSEGSLLAGVDMETKNAKAATAASKVSTAAETSRDGALEQKHRQAMEAYVAQHMGRTDTETIQGSKVLASQGPLSEDALYLDLATQAAKLAGKPVAADDQVSEERGAVLVAGTGIAEVILPVEERLQTAQATTQAQAEAAARRRTVLQHHSSIQSDKSAIPNRFAVTTALSDKEFRQQYSRDESTTTSNTERASSSSVAATTTAADETRPGFEAVRQSKIAPSTQQGQLRQQQKQHSHQQASDHKVFSKFVARQREMRK